MQPAPWCLAFGFASNKAHAVGAPAGTEINNTAEVSYTVGTVNATANSNLVTVTVAEILDVIVTAQTPTLAVSRRRHGAGRCVIASRTPATVPRPSAW